MYEPEEITCFGGRAIDEITCFLCDSHQPPLEARGHLIASTINGQASFVCSLCVSDYPAGQALARAGLAIIACVGHGAHEGEQ